MLHTEISKRDPALSAHVIDFVSSLKLIESAQGSSWGMITRVEAVS